MRGNRLNPVSYRVLEHLWQTHKYKKYYYPRPIHYFAKKHFLLYESYDGMIYRDYHKKNKGLYYKTIPMIAQRLADFHQTKKGLAKNRTIKEESGFLKTMLKKIKDHNQPFYPTALKATKIIKSYIKKNYQPKNFTLIHNDFQPNNIVYNTYGHNLGIIDYEPLCQFFPGIDLASFITHFKVRLKKYLSQKTLIALQRKFIRTYAKYTKAANLAKINQELPYFIMRSLLDIMAVAAVYLCLSQHRQHRRQFKQLIKYLEKEIKNLLLKIT
jgi:Ser/Thr protein kinase RdoA (MazF antagonist)